MMVSSRTMNPQNVAACAAPGTVHCSSLRWPITSVASTPASRAGCERTPSIRSGAGPPRPAHLSQPPQPPTGHRKRHHGQHQADHDPHNHESLLMRPQGPAGPGVRLAASVRRAGPTR